MNLRPRRILMTADAVGGVWNYALDLAAGLPETEFLLAIMGPAPSAGQMGAAAKLENLAWEHRPGALEWMDEPWHEVDAAGGWLRELAAVFQPDVIHLNGYSHAALEWQAPVLVVAHSCVASWWRAVKGEAMPTSFCIYRERVRRGLNAASIVVAPTHAMMNMLESEHGPVTAAAVVYNGRSAQAFPAAGKRPFIFSAGRIWDEAKNIGLLDHIAPELAWPVYVAGSQAGARAKLRHLPSLGQLSPSRLRSTLGEAAIYAAPAFYEPFGLAILEAALSGCTLVLADIPTLRELWDGAAVFVSPRDPQAWIPALNGLVRDQAQRERLGQLAYERARLYSLERMVQGYDDLYAALLRTSDAGVAA